MGDALTREEVLALLRSAGLPEFELDEENRPIPGPVVKYFREQKTYPDPNHPDKLKHWTQADLGRLAGMTYVQVSNMENYNEGLDSIEKRNTLITILKIPPALLGLTSLEDLKTTLINMSKKEQTSTNAQNNGEAATLYRSVFNAYNNLGKSTYLHGYITELEQCASKLHKSVLNNKRESRDLLYILWEFHNMLTDVYMYDAHNWNKAQTHIHQEIEIAKELSESNLEALSYCQACEMHLLKQDKHSAQLYADAAIKVAPHASFLVQSFVCAWSSIAYKYGSPDLGDRATANKYIDQSQSFLKDQEKDERLLPVRLDNYRCLYHQSDVLWDLDRLSDAMYRLKQAENILPGTTLRQVQLLATQARYILSTKKPKPDYDKALSLLVEAFNLSKTTDATYYNLSDIRNIYHEVAKSPYGNAPEVVDLGMQLRALRHAKS